MSATRMLTLADVAWPRAGLLRDVLLVVGALEPHDLAVLHREARALDLDAIVEVHDEDEIGRASCRERV